ncbi:muconate cycloisomerase [Ensifer adhaerens]|uniref:muconate/chloromuconate family cycloisomerase n=1 Tax=Ensifer canadensis TaxID=555315 RepID=UPI00148F4991|nr:muconate/chloromuconate family cycloisomerase [Ensifer canadensis]NOV20418.1 muconate cycloisomerase [Ensifer canadensis]
MSQVLKVEKVESFIVDIPTIRPHVLAMTTMSTQAMVIIRLLCSDGVEGLGEATTIGGLSYGQESPESIKLTIDSYIAPILALCDPSRPAAVMAAIGKAVTGNHFAKCAVETALLDAMGKRHGLAVSELLGGRVCDRLAVLWTLASGDTQSDIEEADKMLEQRRHRAFKIKIGKRPLAEDVAHVAAIKLAVGDRASIRVDVNQAWDEVTAKRGMAMLADVGVDLVEQPIPGTNRAAMARLKAMSGIPLMADEALHGPSDAFDFASSGCADVFSVKIAQSGGLSAGKAVSHIAEAAGVALYGGTMLEGGIGTAASAQLFSTFAKISFGTELFGPLLLTEEILAKPLTYSDFNLILPIGAGIGVSLDEDAVAAFRRDRTVRSIVTFPKALEV